MPYKDSEAHKEAKRRWYQKNKALTIKRSMEHKHRDQEWFKSIKSQAVCVSCGHDVYEDLDYHHIDPSTKIATVADMLGAYGRPKILAEMAKCEVLCKKCHRNHHINHGNPRQTRDPKTGRFMKHTT